MNKKYFPLAVALAIPVCAIADEGSLRAEKAKLEAQLSEINSELTACKKVRKTGVALTAIGAAATVGGGIWTGVAASKTAKLNKDLKEEKTKLGTLKGQVDAQSKAEGKAQGDEDEE